MGLDMYLEGRKGISSRWDNKDEQIKEDGFVVKAHVLDLGYWRKHPDLHGFIVQEFANGVDECQGIYLCEDDLQKIIETVEKDEIPTGVEGFFFGKSYAPGESDEIYSYEQQKANDLAIFDKALKWLKSAPTGEWREVYYEASW